MNTLIKRLVVVSLLVVVLALVGGGVSAETNAANAPSAIFLVNSTNDSFDGSCNSSHCSLREAIVLAGQTSAHDTIRFDFDSASLFVTPQSSLPVISQPVTIDGIAGTGAACPNVLNPAALNVTLNGIVAGTDAIGLRFVAGGSDSIVKGLAFINFDDAGVEIDGASDVRIECNHIGVAINGNAAGNDVGVRITGNGTDNVVGGTTSNTRSQRNVISGNDRYGVYILNDGNDRAVISGNYIGTDVLGTSAIPNDDAGVVTYGDQTIIGGSNSYEANVISGNGAYGIWIVGNSVGVDIDGNFIGTNLIGSAAVPNSIDGIRIQNATTAPQLVDIGLNRPNIIASNLADGITITGTPAPTKVTIRYNAIYDNGSLGIDLNSDGVSLNDGGDYDGGANSTQNYPEMESAEASGRITGSFIRGGNLDDYAIDVYTNSSCNDDSVSNPHGEGQTYHGTFTIPGGAVGPVAFDETVAPLPLGKFVSLTATYLGTGNTSEFSNCIEITPSPIVVNSTANGADLDAGDGVCSTGSGSCSLQAAIEEANGLGAGDSPHLISFAVGGSFHLGASLNVDVPVLLDGTTFAGTSCPTQSTAATLPVIVSGRDMSSGALIRLNAGSDGSIVRGLRINNSPDDGIQIRSNDNLVACTRIGGNPAAAIPEGIADDGIHIIGGDDNRIGTDASYADRNVILGSSGAGIQIDSSAGDNIIAGNHIGLEADGVTAHANVRGVHLLGTAFQTTIGGSSAVHSNYIAGNSDDGILVSGSASYVNILGNSIGTPIANGRDGIRADNAYGIFVGLSLSGTPASAPNLIEDNGGQGVYLIDSDDSQVKDNHIEGNGGSGIRVIDGYAPSIRDNDIFDNDGSGIYMNGGVLDAFISDNTIGMSGARGNQFDGIHLNGDVRSVTIRDNAIAGNGRYGVNLYDASSNTIEDNLLDDNGSSGVRVSQSEFVTIDNNIIRDNGGSGVYLTDVVTSVTVISNSISGSTFDGVHVNETVAQSTLAENTITSNGRSGIRVDSDSFGVVFDKNSIADNGELGIDLGENGLTENDDVADSDTGANGQQNFPDIESADSASGTIEGSLNTAPNKTYTLQFFSSRSCDSFSTTHGEGTQYIGEITRSTPASGKVGFSVTRPGTFAQGDQITATATGEDGTSEFSKCFAATGPVTTAVAVSQQSAASSQVGLVLGALFSLLLISFLPIWEIHRRMNSAAK